MFMKTLLILKMNFLTLKDHIFQNILLLMSRLLFKNCVIGRGVEIERTVLSKIIN